MAKAAVWDTPALSHNINVFRMAVIVSIILELLEKIRCRTIEIITAVFQLRNTNLFRCIINNRGLTNFFELVELSINIVRYISNQNFQISDRFQLKFKISENQLYHRN